MYSKKEIGDIGERHTIELLEKKGFEILATNWRYFKAEIDIIAIKDGVICFTEVKTRSSLDFGNPQDFVSSKQQKLIVSAAHHFLIKNSIDEEARFDVSAVLVKNNCVIDCDYIEDAFYPIL